MKRPQKTHQIIQIKLEIINSRESNFKGINYFSKTLKLRNYLTDYGDVYSLIEYIIT